MSNITILNSYDLLSEKVANIVANHIIKWPVTAIAFPTGSTPIGMYAKLAKHKRCTKVGRNVSE